MADRTVIETAKEYLRLIPASMELKKAYLFGSYAKGRAREDSDIDIALIVGKMDDFFAVQRYLMKLRRKIDLRIEPHPILETDFSAQNPFAFEIQSTGIELKQQGLSASSQK